MQTERLEVIRQEWINLWTKLCLIVLRKQSGQVSRSLKKAFESFHIEQQKERNREVKFVNNCSDFIQSTAQKFADENAMMTASLYTLEDDVVENERRASQIALSPSR